MIEPKCGNCIHWRESDGACLVHRLTLPECCEVCNHYSDSEGKRPRFCRLASSVDEMAEAMVIPVKSTIVNAHSGNIEFEDRFKSLSCRTFRWREEAVADNKAWLMEVEE